MTTPAIEDLRRASDADPDDLVVANHLLAAEMRLGFDPLPPFERSLAPPWRRGSGGVRATHKPTGITVAATEERSQLRNRALALVKLRAAVAFARQPDLRGVGIVRDWSRDWDDCYAYEKKVGRLRLVRD